jgi:hypothetical protein
VNFGHIPRFEILGCETEVAQRRNKLTVKQGTIVAQSHEPSRHEPALKAERILMADFTATQARAKGVAPSTNREGG